MPVYNVTLEGVTRKNNLKIVNRHIYLENGLIGKLSQRRVSMFMVNDNCEIRGLNLMHETK